MPFRVLDALSLANNYQWYGLYCVSLRVLRACKVCRFVFYMPVRCVVRVLDAPSLAKNYQRYGLYCVSLRVLDAPSVANNY